MDISVAVATPRGLVVPVLRNVESMDYPAIELTIGGLAEKARSGKKNIRHLIPKSYELKKKELEYKNDGN